MTSTDQPGQERYRPRITAMPPHVPLLGDGSRILLLAVGGFFIVRIALALLRLV